MSRDCEFEIHVLRGNSRCAKIQGSAFEYLNTSRGLQTSFENIMITRGSQHGMYLITAVLFSKGENIIVGDTNYYYADHCFEHAGMNWFV